MQRMVRGALGSADVTRGRRPGRAALLGARSPRPSSRSARARSTTPARSSCSAATRCTRCRSSTCGSARPSAATAPSCSSPPSGRPRSTAAPRRRFRGLPRGVSLRPGLGALGLHRGPRAPRSAPAPRTPRRRASPTRCATPARSSSSGARACSPATTARTCGALLGVADVLGLDGMDGGGLSRSRSPPTAAACARSAAPGLRPRVRRGRPRGRSAAEIRAALEAGEIEALILSDVDPVRDFDDPEGWKAALAAADFTLSVSMFDGPAAKAADVIFPPRRTPRRRAPSPIPTVACSASGLGAPPGRRATRVAGADRALGPPRRRDRRRSPPARSSSICAAEIPFYADITLDQHRRDGPPLARRRPGRHRRTGAAPGGCAG